MKWIHRATLTAFAKPEEDAEAIKQGIIALVPFNLEEAKIKLDIQNAESFEERIIKIFTIILTKESHTNDFLQFLLDNLSDEQKKLLLAQAESRLDKEFDFFMRIEKDKWVRDRKIILTDSGHCFHIKLSLATFPKKRETALALINKLFAIGNL
jgi:RNA binding exosome subunit